MENVTFSFVLFCIILQWSKKCKLQFELCFFRLGLFLSCIFIYFTLLKNKGPNLFKYYNNVLDLGFMYILQDAKYKMLQIKSKIYFFTKIKNGCEPPYKHYYLF